MQKRRMLIIKQILLFTVLLISPRYGISGTAGDYLLMQDISAYKMMGSGGGKGSGIVSATNHFSIDHADESYAAIYFHDTDEIGITVQVTQHAGSDSDKWLMHEVEDGYRDPDILGAILTEGTVLRIINGNRVFNWGAGSYTWLSGTNIVVRIEYTDLTGSKPEPVEIVQAYLQKFPSTITLTDAEAKSRDHNEKWIKDEMDRRLWLCDRWFAQYQLGKVEQGKVLDEAVDHMNVFLDYREKYYGISAKDEKIALNNYLQQKDEASIKNKLTEYKTWWSANKTGTINLP